MHKIIGYHGTKKRFADSILKEGFKKVQIIEGDNHWLGHGIYFYADYELAEWWAETKVRKHNKKYKQFDIPVVVKGEIEAGNILDLDKPFMLNLFKKYQKKLEEQMVKDGVVLDFTKGKGHSCERIRCFWMDAVKEEHNIDVVIYTFPKKNPSYIDSDYHVNTTETYSLGNMGLTYHEKQICVTANNCIVDKSIVSSSLGEFEEVII